MPFDVNARVVLERVEFSTAGKKKVADKVRFKATLKSGTDDPIEVGNKNQDFNIPGNCDVILNWSKDIAGKAAFAEGYEAEGEKTVKLRFDCIDQTDPKPSLGSILYEIHKRADCWKQEIHNSTTVGSGNYTLKWTVYLEAKGAYEQHDPNTILASREHKGSVQWSTVSGVRKSVYLGIVPVVPLFSSAEWPKLPAIAYADQEMNPVDDPTVTAASAINTIHNPPVIPKLDEDKATTTTAAKIMYTMYAPSSMRFTADDKRLEWRKIDGTGDVAFVAKDPRKQDRADKGLEVLVRGTTEGDVVLGVHFDGKVLTKYRALVKTIKKIPCRFNLLTGKAKPPASPRESVPKSGPQDVEKHRKIANIYLRQVGLELVCDSDTSIRSGSAATKTAVDGIFTEKVDRKYTRNPNVAQREHGLTLNYRNDVLNFTYMEGTSSNGGALSWPESKLGGRSSASVSDSGTPSSSWIRPTGLKPENDAGDVELKIIDRRAIAEHAKLYGMYINNTCGDDPGGTDAKIYGRCIAHEVGHMLTLGHRVEGIKDATLKAKWNAGTLEPAAGGKIAALTNDKLDVNGIFCDGLWHPRRNNLMYYIGTRDKADFDILQALAVWQSPLVG